MTGGFGIRMDNARRVSEKYTGTYRAMKNYSASIQGISNNLPGGSYENVKRVLQGIARQNDLNAESVQKLEKALEACIALYAQTEKRIVEHSNANPQAIEKPESHQGGTAPDSSSEEESIWDYLWDAIMQMVGGDFYDDGNLLGIIGSVLIGCIPVLGQICDVRDLIADIANLIDDGPQTSEWFQLGFTLLGFIIPAIGDYIKHADEGAEAAGGIVKHGDEIISGIRPYIDDFNDFFQKNIFDKLDDLIGNTPSLDKIRQGLEKFLNINTGFFDKTTGEILYEFIEKFTGDTVVDWVQENWDGNGLQREDLGSVSMLRRGFVCAA